MNKTERLVVATKKLWEEAKTVIRVMMVACLGLGKLKEPVDQKPKLEDEKIGPEERRIMREIELLEREAQIGHFVDRYSMRGKVRPEKGAE